MNTIDNLFDELDKKPETFKEKLKDFWIDIEIFYEKYIYDVYLGIKNYIRNVIRYSKILWRDHDWDFDFFLNIQDKKLEFMQKYHEKSNICVENPWMYSRIKLARNLLSISRSEDSDKHEELFWTPYVNTRNAKRYVPDWDLRTQITSEKGKQMLLYDLRLKKSWYLYNKCLFQYTHSWWD